MRFAWYKKLYRIKVTAMITKSWGKRKITFTKRYQFWIINLISLPLIFIICLLIYFFCFPQYYWTPVNAITTSESPAITPGVTILQPFQAPWNNFSGISVLFYENGEGYPENSTLDILVFDEYGGVLSSINIPASEIKHGQYYTITFPEVRDSRLKQYFLQFSTTNLADGMTIASSKQAQSPSLSYFVNGELKNETLVVKMRFSNPPIDNQSMYYFLAVTMLIWTLFSLRRMISKLLARIPFFITASVLILLLGITSLIIEPPLHMYDESMHFRRTWEVSNGLLEPTLVDDIRVSALPIYIQTTFDRISFYTGGANHNPLQLHEMLLEKPGDPTLYSTYLDLSNSYNFLAYIISALFVKAGVFFHSSALGLTYLARLAFLLQYVFLTGWALKNARKGKYSIAVVAMLPLVIAIASAINVDALLFGGSFLFLSSVVNSAYTGDNHTSVTNSEIWGMIVGTFFILISKYLYVLMLGLMLLIPSTKLGGWKRKIVFIGGFWLVAFVSAIAIQAGIPLSVDPRVDNSNINGVLQFRHILEYPLDWFKVVFTTLQSQGLSFINQFNNITVTSQSIGLVAIAQAVIVLYFSWYESGDFSHRVKLIDRIIICIVLVFLTMMIMLPLYMTWTPLAAVEVNGLQGRYFIPLVTIVLMLFKPRFFSRGKADYSLLLSMGLLALVQMGQTYLFFY
jgi:uncharacterized membrane protein